MATLNPCTMTFGSGEFRNELASALDRPAASVQETAALLRLPPR
jgi:hypothetical protein